MSKQEMKGFLDEKYQQYNQPAFLEHDPVQIPHLFTKKEDQEISGFLAASIAWGNRVSILKSAKSMLERMDQEPFEYVMNASSSEMASLEGFVHRTFNEDDFRNFILGIRRIYLKGGMESHFSNNDVLKGIASFRKAFFDGDSTSRTQKHVSNPEKGSASKRLNMFLRWMVRKDRQGVDLGIWKKVDESCLMLPLDVHTGNTGRALGLLSRKQNDWTAVVEITEALREFDPKDPIKYDFALFGLGVNEGFNK
ncbi:MAG: TIGR02757 family protein [Bacteroidota bacterium]